MRCKATFANAVALMALGVLSVVATAASVAGNDGITAAQAIRRPGPRGNIAPNPLWTEEAAWVGVGFCCW
jgi:hypothetical protein